MANELVPIENVALVKESGAHTLLNQIRPQWQGKKLIGRVKRLLEIDPSSACQRLFNAAIHDLRQKVVIAGLDIASEAAKQNKLPAVSNHEDVENYPTAKLIDLTYRMGLLDRQEWRKVHRCYEIRRDLEHEDDEYEAGVEDCVYVFRTCINAVLSVDPVHLLRVVDVKDLVEQPGAATLGEDILDDYEHAPQIRQEEIMKFLISQVLNSKQSDIVQKNAFAAISLLKTRTHDQVLLNVGTHMQEKIGRSALDARHVRVAFAAGVLSYLRQNSRKAFFESISDSMAEIGHRWDCHNKHGGLLRRFKEYGAFSACPDGPKEKILKWMALAYLGEPGGRTQYGNVRHVFYSNTAEPLINDIIADNAKVIRDDLCALEEDADIQKITGNAHIARRFEQLLDIIEDEE